MFLFFLVRGGREGEGVQAPLPPKRIMVVHSPYGVGSTIYQGHCLASERFRVFGFRVGGLQTRSLFGKYRTLARAVVWHYMNSVMPVTLSLCTNKPANPSPRYTMLFLEDKENQPSQDRLTQESFRLNRKSAARRQQPAQTRRTHESPRRARSSMATHWAS